MSDSAFLIDPYFREDPGPGAERKPVYHFNLESDFDHWKPWRTNDGRILPNSQSGFELIDNPFDPGSLILLTNTFDPAVAGKSFGGFGMRVKIDPPIEMDELTFIEFDIYYPKTAGNKYMRFEIWSTSSGGEGPQIDAGFTGTNNTQVYIRENELEEINALNPEWIGFYKGETWYRKKIRAMSPVKSGIWEYLNIDIHTETGMKLDNDLLLLGNIFISKKNSGINPFKNVINEKYFNEVSPIKGKYNTENGYFYIGTTGTGIVEKDSIRGYHFQIFVDQNNLKPEIHVGPPGFLKNLYPEFDFRKKRGKSLNNDDNIEWVLPTDKYSEIIKSGSEYKIHGHCLAWFNQSPPWMMQLIPETLQMQWNENGLYYSGGSIASGPYQKISKEIARRIYFDHTVYLMRHFMSTDNRYGSSKERGIIPFYSFDVLNEEVHEGWHRLNLNNWRAAIKNTSWLMAMTDNEKDIKDHFIYLLFKFAHIAVPNVQMAKKYKENYHNPDAVGEYMKLDNHDKEGSIDDYITENPPILIYNDYISPTDTKPKVIQTMIKEINLAWKDDPLYDGRNLIESFGIQGHERVDRKTASHNLSVIKLFTDLIDNKLLDSICFSEFDIKQYDGSPGGECKAPAILNEKQADCIGYQYALFFKLFEKFKKYISHVIIWGEYGEGWQASYVVFDHEKMASNNYYAMMDPDRFIAGHSYLDSFYEGEYEKILNE